MSLQHISVLLHEVITGLEFKPSDIFFDGTVNGGGHSETVTKLIGKEGMIIGTDLDDAALAKAAKRLDGAAARIVLRKANFKNLDMRLVKEYFILFNREDEFKEIIKRVDNA